MEVRSSSLSEEIRLRTRMRGTLNWAPPRFQILFNLQPPHRSSSHLRTPKPSSSRTMLLRHMKMINDLLCVSPADAVKWCSCSTTCVQAVGQRWSPVSTGSSEQFFKQKYFAKLPAQSTQTVFLFASYSHFVLNLCRQ